MSVLLILLLCISPIAVLIDIYLHLKVLNIVNQLLSYNTNGRTSEISEDTVTLVDLGD